LVQEQVKDYLSGILKPEESELSFWRAFATGEYQPELLFDDAEIISRIEHHCTLTKKKTDKKAPDISGAFFSFDQYPERSNGTTLL